MSRLNLVARIDSSFPDKTAYKRVLDTGKSFGRTVKAVRNGAGFP